MIARTLAFLALIAVGAATNADGIAFLKANQGKEGVTELPSGLQYKVIRKGDGDSHPTANSPCECA